MILTDQNFKQEVEDYQGLVLVDFFATWCGPCQIMMSVVEEIASEYQGKDVKIGKINIEENNQTTDKYGVMTVPTFILFKQGKVLEQISNIISKERLEELIDKNLT